MFPNYNCNMSKIWSLMLFCSIVLAEKPKTMNRFVYEYLLVAKSKMECSPNVWQDFREGYFRSKAIRYTDNLLDSLDYGIDPYDIAINHFFVIDSFRLEVLSGREYEMDLDDQPIQNINYFSSFND
tara:strand:- start:479 stop:856 length:378 start_codon:yes stop_codon:yes gene_type:complete